MQTTKTSANCVPLGRVVQKKITSYSELIFYSRCPFLTFHDLLLIAVLGLTDLTDRFLGKSEEYCIIRKSFQSEKIVLLFLVWKIFDCVAKNSLLNGSEKENIGMLTGGRSTSKGQHFFPRTTEFRVEKL